MPDTPASVDSGAVIPDLLRRGLIQDISGQDDLTDHTRSGYRSVYGGFDPTSDSLHVGHLTPLLVLRRFQARGHRPIVLVGGGTGMIGDPSGKTSERQLNPVEVVNTWSEALKNQARRFLDFDDKDTGAIIVDNADWLGKQSLIPFLRDVGKHFPVSAMLAKDSVKRRLHGEGDAEGISFTEFTYTILQAFDFMELRRRYNCTIQIGGSDQWGNIVHGIELNRRADGEHVYGLTVPLLTRADGGKFGKTEEGAVWLDETRTSPFAFYQFWVNAADADLKRYFYTFSFREPDEIDELLAAHGDRPEAREGQVALAREMTETVHGPDGLRSAEAVTAALFGNDLSALSASDIERMITAGLPHAALDSADATVTEALVAVGAAPSKGRARKLVGEGGVSVNGQPLAEAETPVSALEPLFGRFYLLRRGRKHYYVASIGG